MAKKRLALQMNLLRSRFWHRLLGLWLGAVLLLVCLTGSILLFKNPLLQWLYPQLQISLVDDPQLQGRVLDSLDQSQYGFARLPNKDRPWLELSRHDGTLEYWAVPATAAEAPQLLFSRAPYSDVLDWCYQLHLYLFVKSWKHQLLGVVGIGGLLLLIAGLKTQWPSRWRMLKLPLSQRGRTVPGGRMGWHNARQWHYLIGVFSLPLLLLVIITGTAMAYNAQTQQFISWLWQDPPQPKPAPEPAFAATTLTASDWGLWLSTARQALPQAQLRLAPDGSLLSLQRATDLAPGRQLSQLIYPLHVAAVGGPLYLWLLCATGLLPALLWWFGWRWRQGRQQKTAISLSHRHHS